MTADRVQPVVFQPRTREGLLRGARQIVAAVAPTLGPLPRHVAVERTASRTGTPELLDDAATIARRVLELPDRDADVGAMLARDIICRQGERSGDGSATAAILYGAAFAGGIHYLAAGGNPMILRRHLEEGTHAIMQSLQRMAVPVRGKARLAEVALGACRDAETARLLGEIFDIVGEDGYVDIRLGQGRTVQREYVEGMYWDGGAHSRGMLPEGAVRRTEAENAAILLTDLDLTDPKQLIPVLQACRESGAGGLAITARSIADPVAAILAANSGEGFRLFAVKPPHYEGGQEGQTLADAGLLTGARPFIGAAGDTLAAFKPEHLGRARRAWADLEHFGLSGGRGDPRALRTHVAGLRQAFRASADDEIRSALQRRIGRLLGGTAVLTVGGMHELEAEARKGLAERGATVVRGALREGALPGGGAALLACRAELAGRRDRAGSPDERAAYRILSGAVEAPVRTLAANAGYEPAWVMAQLQGAAPGCGFDVERGEVVDMLAAGIVDSASVIRGAVAGAFSGAAIALTVDAIVHHHNRQDGV